jgi:hypothetical protein
MYNLPYAYAYALSDMRRITLVLMHIVIQPPSSYKSSFSYKISDGAETHDPSTHATILVAIWQGKIECIDYCTKIRENARDIYKSVASFVLYRVSIFSSAEGQCMYAIILRQR